MKNLIFTCLSMAMLFATNTISAQKTLDQGYLKLEIIEVDSEDEQMATMLQMMVGSQTEVHFDKGRNLSTMNMMGGMVKTQTLFEEKDQTVSMLIDMMGQKMHVKSSTKEMEASSTDQNKEMEKFKVEYDESDTKEIAGYNCIKAIIKDPKEEKAAFELYVSRDIKANAKMLQGLQHFDIDGFPLEVFIRQSQMSMRLTAKEIKSEVDTTVFNLNTEGYPTLTFAQFMEKLNALGGAEAFGF